MNDLKVLRNKIDSIDNEIFALLEKRMIVSKLVKEYKEINKVNVLDNTREQEIYQNIDNLNIDGSLKEKIKEIYDSILKTSKELQM